MGRLALICITWMVISAVTAYYADIWGKRLGKKRKTIGRLRPKHTAIVIITSAGALIALLSFVILLTADAGIRRALLNWDQTVAQMRALQTELTGVQTALATEKAQVAAVQKQLEESRAYVASASARVEAARKKVVEQQAELARIQEVSRITTAKLSSTRAELSDASARLSKTNATLAIRQRELKTAERNLAKAQVWLGEAFQRTLKADLAVARTLQGEVAARKGDELGRVVVPRGVSVNRAREILRRLLNDAGLLVQERAKGSSYAGKQFVAVRDKYVVQRVNGKLAQVKISGQKSMDLASARLAGSSVPPGGTVVRLVAKANAMGGDTVPVDFELYENHVIFDRNQVLASFETRAADGKPPVMTALTTALRDVRAKALDSGLIPAADGSVGSLPPYQLPDVYSEVIKAYREGQQTVPVRIMALQETWTSDELKLRFEVQRFTKGG